MILINFLELLYNEFKNIRNNNETIISSVDQFKMEFSSWVKNNNKNMVECLKDFIKNASINEYINLQKGENTKNYLKKLYKDLLLLFFNVNYLSHL